MKVYKVNFSHETHSIIKLLTFGWSQKKKNYRLFVIYKKKNARKHHSFDWTNVYTI